MSLLAAQVRVLGSDPSAVSYLEPDFPFLPASGWFSYRLMLLHFFSHILTSIIPVPCEYDILQASSMTFLSCVLPTGTQHSSGRTWGLADQQIRFSLAVKEIIEGVVGRGSESGQFSQQILSWGFPPSVIKSILFALSSLQERVGITASS